MPLIHSNSKPAFKKNVKAEMDAGKPQNQALAIAYAVKRRARAAGGQVFEGPIVSAVPGRTDDHPMDVASGSYVLPSSHVASLGEDNTMAGMAHLKKIGPHGIRKLAHAAPGAAGIVRKHKAKGGIVRSAGGSTGAPIPIAAAGGEVVMPPHDVSVVGDGDIDLGHRLLDNWIVQGRKKHISVLKGLAPPARD